MAIQVQIRASETHQKIESFGASGAWWAQLVGGWPEATRTQIIKLLFSKTEGVGVGAYRYNLGGGSKESGKGNFPNKNRSASSFLREDGSYDWSRDAEAVWCLQEAVRQGAEEVVLFVNSPPERWTITGTAQGKIPFKANLKRKHELDFVQYMLDVTEHFLADGIPVRFISPINEPFGPWIARTGQEGCHYHPAGVRRLLRRFAQEMDRHPALQNVLLSGAENNDLRLMNKTYTRAVLDDPILRKRVDGIDVHGYVFKPLQSLKGVKQRFRKYMDKRYPGVPIRLSEWTHMQGGRDYGMGSALEQAKNMWEDLEILGVVSWQCWVAVSDVDFCDGLLYVDEDTQTYSIPKRYYAFGNFAKFLPRGAQRVGVATPGAPASLQSLAFTASGQTILVFINHDTNSLELTLENPPTEAELFVTSEDKSLEPQRVQTNAFTLPGRSVCTLVVKG
ncbi:MAG: hypothetical protein LBS96_10410 [Oscillospiraceae bacterium]|nr:hypothetical protein [Oscillospiraceae bacterium]